MGLSNNQQGQQGKPAAEGRRNLDLLLKKYRRVYIPF